MKETEINLYGKSIKVTNVPEKRGEYDELFPKANGNDPLLSDAINSRLGINVRNAAFSRLSALLQKQGEAEGSEVTEWQKVKGESAQKHVKRVFKEHDSEALQEVVAEFNVAFDYEPLRAPGSGTSKPKKGISCLPKAQAYIEEGSETVANVLKQISERVPAAAEIDAEEIDAEELANLLVQYIKADPLL